jgi:PAS domain S-box-containing protein
MPFAASRREARIVDFLRHFRDWSAAAYGIAVLTVGLASLARFGLDSFMVPGVVFITFYPAIIVATFLGRLGPGLLAVVLSTLAAWYFFLPPEYSWALSPGSTGSLLVFLGVSGTLVALIVFLNDALERVLAREEEVRALIESSPNGVIVVDSEGKVRLFNAGAEKLFGYPRAELLGQNIEALVPDHLIKAHEGLRKAYLKEPETRPMGANRDLSGRRKDGSEVPIEVGLSGLDRDGKHVVIASVVDVSERKKAQDQQRVLIGEMHHRMQNLFAIVAAVIRKAFDVNNPPSETRDMLLARLQSLARAHAMLAEAAWQGAPLDEIVRRELEPFTDRFEIRGCDITVDASAAQNFALIVHELATNATKHGALSVPGGRITVEGKVDPSGGETLFSFSWRESGGPPAAVPIRKGFGSKVLLDMARMLGKDVNLSYGPAGLSYELLLRLSAIQATSRPVFRDPLDARVG